MNFSYECALVCMGYNGPSILVHPEGHGQRKQYHYCTGSRDLRMSRPEPSWREETRAAA
jgi:hypothetical protein